MSLPPLFNFQGVSFPPCPPCRRHCDCFFFFSKPSTVTESLWTDITGTNMKPVTLVSAFRHSILATQRHAQVLGHFVLY